MGGLLVRLTVKSTSSAAGSRGSSVCEGTTVADDVLPSVVTVLTTAATGGSGNGSGEIIRSGGYILTNDHVISSAADGGEVSARYSDGTTLPGDDRRTGPAHRPRGHQGRGRGPKAAP